MSNFILQTDEVNDEALQQYAAQWVAHVKAAIHQGGGNSRIEMRAIYDVEKPVEVVLEYVLEPKVEI